MLKHEKNAHPTSVGTVKEINTSEISKFYKPYVFNRGEGEPDIARVKKIAKSIIGSEEIPPVYNGTFWLVSPLIVNSRTKVIVDGHYTKAALERVLDLKGWDLPVLVIEKEFPKGMPDREIVSMFNNMRKPWAVHNYIECYVLEGLEDYVKLKNAAIELGYPFTNKQGKVNYRYTSALLGSSQQTPLKKGEFKYADTIVERGEQVKALFAAMGGKQTSAWFESFIIAYCGLLGYAPDAFESLRKNISRIDWGGDIGKSEWWQKELGSLVFA